MSERKLENHVLWVVCSMLILIVWTLVLSMVYGDEEFPLLGSLIDPISIFLGALVGALITGKVANDIHRKEFERLELIDQRTSLSIRKIQFYYTTIIDAQLENARDKLEKIEIYDNSMANKKNSKEISELIELRKSTREKMILNLKQITDEFNEMNEVNILGLDHEALYSYLEYKSNMIQVAIPLLEESIQEEHFKLITYQTIKDINTKYLKYNNI